MYVLADHKMEIFNLVQSKFKILKIVHFIV